MCSGSRSKACSSDLAMEAVNDQKQQELVPGFSLLLEFSASDDIRNFQKAVEEEGHDINEVGLWYVRRVNEKKMGYEERTPLMVAATFGSKKVLNYILEKGCIDVNKPCGSDRSTALHCAVFGGSRSMLEVVKLLLDASADVDLVDAYGKRAIDLMGTQSCCLHSRRKILETLLGGSNDEEQQLSTPTVSKFGSEKKEYPVDPSLPDIKNGIYGTDNFRMYIFKVKPCSRAYSHDWTECPFVHPGENARRRDPSKYHYSCVPCPDFRKGTCQKGDNCEYAHGIFECWLHPAQYRTRMCKDETNCNRRVCFFAHKPEELRPLYPSTGSAVLSPRSFPNGGSSLDIASISTPPISPSTGANSSAGGSLMWPYQSSLATPTLQLPISRLKTASSARDMQFDNALHGYESRWNSDRDGLNDILATLDSKILAQLHMTSYSSGQSSPSFRTTSNSYGIDPSLSSRSAAFAKRSQSFIDRSGGARLSNNLSGWGSPDGKLDWGIQKEELNKLRKSASFGLRSSGSSYSNGEASAFDSSVEPDVSWVQSREDQQYRLNTSRSTETTIPTWTDLYMEQEQIVH